MANTKIFGQNQKTLAIVDPGQAKKCFTVNEKDLSNHYSLILSCDSDYLDCKLADYIPIELKKPRDSLSQRSLSRSFGHYVIS